MILIYYLHDSYQALIYRRTEYVWSWHISLPSLFPSDAVHAVVQQTGEAPSAKMVRSSIRQGEEENHAGAGANGSGPQAQDVQLPGVEGP